MRFAHVMIRVKDLDNSINFYTTILSMKVIKKTDNHKHKYTLAFLGYGEINNNTVLELTYNWDNYKEYAQGSAFGHLCIEVENVYKTCEEIKSKGNMITRNAGPVKGGTSVIAFIKDPDGYQIELIEKKDR